MNCNWKEFRLGDLTTWGSGSTPSKQNSSFWGGKIPWISGTVMRSKNLSESDLYLTQEGLDNKGKLCKKDSILLLVRGDLFKRIPIGIATKSLCFNQDIKAINSVSDNLLQHFIYYLLEGNKKRLSNIVEFTGLGAGKLDTKLLQDLTFKIPPVNYQKNLINFIDSIDSKIELNKESNKNLEETAKALFKSWFIDFDPVRAKSEGLSTRLPYEISNLFPDSFEDSELGNIPKNWNVKKLGNIISIKYGKNFPTKNLLESGFPVFGGNGIIGYHSSFLYKEEMTLMSCRGAASGSILRSLPESVITNNSLVMDHTSNKFPSQRYIEYFLQSTDLSGFITGSAQPQVTIESIYDLSFSVPNYELLEYYQNLINPLNQKSLLIMKQNKNLELLRNTLLPKLISGELRIPDAEKMIDEAGI